MLSFFYLWFVLGPFGCLQVSASSSYSSIKALEESIMSSANYNPRLRPVRDQNDILTINVSFSLVAVLALDDVKQEMTTNGFMPLSWIDEMNTWDAAAYNGVSHIMPDTAQVWKPRFHVINTMGDRDPFGDDHTHTRLAASGRMLWVPGSLFKTYCRLDMEKFPFDQQRCHIQLCPMGHRNDSVRFLGNPSLNMAFFFPNPGWQLVGAQLLVEEIAVTTTGLYSCPTIYLDLKRRPDIIVFSVLLPIVVLSFLNNLAFLIPDESGEKISYAVTVLLSLFVFLSMVSTMTPQKSDIVPSLTRYLFILLISSVLTTALAIVTVFLHHKDEKEQVSLKSKSNFRHVIQKVTNIQRAVSPASPHKGELTLDPPPPQEHGERQHEYNRYRVISLHMNKVFFIVVTLLWLIATIWFFATTNS